jgi:hypothetical protein
MKALAAAAAASGILFLLLGRQGDTAPVLPDPAIAASATAGLVHEPHATSGLAAPMGAGAASAFAHDAATALASPSAPLGGGPPEIPPEALTEYVHRLCALCHSDALLTGNLSLQSFDVAAAASQPEIAEKMISKLRAGMMPPPGIPRAADTLQALVETLETLVDEAAAENPNPGTRTFQRLNRAEYERSIRGLLGLEINAGDWLPLDTKSANFDNIADVQMPSATLLNSYLNAAAEISRLAVGDPQASPTSATYAVPRLASQWDRVEGAPIGTRGGTSAIHNFPADGQYVFTVTLHSIPTGQLFGSTAPFDERIEISVDGERVALLQVDRWMSQADPNGMVVTTEPIPVRAGSRTVAAAFLRTFDGPVNDNIAPIGHSIADTQIGAEHGVTSLPHLREMVIAGPYEATGVSETDTRRRIFHCRPTSAEEEAPCAQRIIAMLGGAAYRRPLLRDDLAALMTFYETGAAEGGFEVGIRSALEAILASPHFIFRLERVPDAARPGQSYPIADVDLASRLSFFLWGSPPDDALLSLAEKGALADPAVLVAQARRMLEDPRSEALATRFAAQWLRLQDLDKVHPDALQFPDFHEQLAEAMRRETELFFSSIVRDDRSVLDLFDADYTFVNETLARHYGIPGVTGPEFRRVSYPDDRRAGLLGHGSVLTLTSHANRTSPVLRGKWVMEVLLGTPPPPPPPGIPDLEETEGSKDGRMLTTRERMEMHRSNAVCRSCHQFMDPIGLALDNFDVTGHWRIRENGMSLDTRGELYDGTAITTPAELRSALLARPVPLIRTFTENLMAYALGRRIAYYDKPTIRAIARAAEADDYRISNFVLGIVESEAFRMRRVPKAVAVEEGMASSRQP